MRKWVFFFAGIATIILLQHSVAVVHFIIPPNKQAKPTTAFYFLFSRLSGRGKKSSYDLFVRLLFFLLFSSSWSSFYTAKHERKKKEKKRSEKEVQVVTPLFDLSTHHICAVCTYIPLPSVLYISEKKSTYICTYLLVHMYNTNIHSYIHTYCTEVPLTKALLYL